MYFDANLHQGKEVIKLMEQSSRTILKGLFLLLSCCCVQFGTSITNTITSSQFIKDPEFIISSGNTFKLGFFSPPNSTNRYVGIWYNVNTSVTAVVWVANRNKPLNDSSGIFTISEDGNLVVLSVENEILWSSNVSNIESNSSAQLLDSGDLVLNNNGNIVWSGFEQPSDSFLENSKLSANVRTGQKTKITSWKSPSDPSIGSFSAGIRPLNIPETFIWNEDRPFWRSGPWNGRAFLGIPGMSSIYLNGFSLVNDGGNFYLTFTFANELPLLYYALNSQGILEEKYWVDEQEDWEVTWSAPKSECDLYGYCGAFGSCNLQNSPICDCLTGFEPKNKEEWSRGNWTSGCMRKTMLQCDRIKSGGKAGKGDEFLKLQNMKLPNLPEWSNLFENECREQCLNNCSCLAYAFDNGIGCMSWSGNLIDIQEFSSTGTDLYLRAAYSELDKKDFKVRIIIGVIAGTFIVIICTFFAWRWAAKYRAKKKLRDSMNPAKIQELSLFKFEVLVMATNNFHLINKLGQGGFGPVYKGKLPDGREIAVKRLSRASGQGLEEFMNEVDLISKLQHRNLVRLLGCCVEGEEKMLVYEYMPNKSLDVFLFDPLKQEVLDWRKRFNIIEGIGRGLLYLHRDSRLKIIHRDLKASNILLDQELNPKISDFGMARIFRGNEDQANTKRVVGTYGYMAPEYAMEGRFSEKSDVYSFGVLLVEIVSGQRNSSFYNDERSLSLLAYAWKLWREDNVGAMIDPSISNPCFNAEIVRCIHVGLLCVQEYAKDRPNVSTIISMLNSEIVDLPSPQKPAFTEGRNGAVDTNFFRLRNKNSSLNNLSVTVIQGR